MAAAWNGRQNEITDPCQLLAVSPRCLPPRLVPLIQKRKLVSQNRSLDRVEPRRIADHVVVVLQPLSMLAQRANLLRKSLVVGNEGAGIAERAEVLSRIEAECRRNTNLAGAHAVPICAMGLARILDDRKRARTSELAEPRHIRELTVEVYRHDGARAMRDSSSRCIGGERVVGLVHVRRDGRRSHLTHGFERRDECRRGYDDLVAGADPERVQRESECIQAAADTDAYLAATKSRECVLELGDG